MLKTKFNPNWVIALVSWSSSPFLAMRATKSFHLKILLFEQAIQFFANSSSQLKATSFSNISQISTLHSWYQISHQVLLFYVLSISSIPPSPIYLYDCCPSSSHYHFPSVLFKSTFLIVSIQSYYLPTHLSAAAWEM